MRFPQTSTRQRLVIVASALLAFGLSTTANGAKHKVSAGQAGRDRLASQRTSYEVSGDPISTSYLIRSSLERDFVPTGPTLVSAHVAVGSLPSPALPDSGLTLVLVGLSLVGGAVFIRRITPGQLSSLRPDVERSPTATFIPGKHSARIAK